MQTDPWFPMVTGGKHMGRGVSPLYVKDMYSCVKQEIKGNIGILGYVCVSERCVQLLHACCSGIVE